MTTVLVVDDSAVDRHLAGGLLRKRGLTAVFASHGREALELIDREQPDIVVTDLQMPEMDGLELTGAIRRRFPFLPVVLMTAHGSEEIAVQALQRGAASYVAKRNLAHELADTVGSVLELTAASRNEERLLSFLTRTESHFEIDSDMASITPLVGHLEASLKRQRLCDETGSIQVAVALREALVNAIYHGNLELSSELIEKDEQEFLALAKQRRADKPWCERRVRVTSVETRDRAVYVVADDGAGFDPSALPDPTDLSNLDKRTGRGLLLIRTFMDEVSHNAAGNEITMVKRADPELGPRSSRRPMPSDE
jgi:CheY-like chemotaxis protein